MNKVFIIHYQPIELYPPIQNFIRVLEGCNPNSKFYILSTKGLFNELDLLKSNNLNIKIIRLGISGTKMNKIKRGINYLKFYAGSMFYLLKNWPNKILYYETLSSLTPYLYNRYFNKKSNVYIHYHEYTSPQEYQKGMLLTKLFHEYEKYLYPLAKWVSHTNAYRMQLFKNDIIPTVIGNEKIFANYPPKNWITSPSILNTTPLKIIYAGSLSMDTMYTQKFAEWVQAQNGRVVWHIYSYNLTAETIEYLKKLSSKYISLKSGVNYDDLPNIFKKYNVGVVLYNGHIPNYIYNAPNKLFEYLSCGLDVWYPKVMEGCFPYDSIDTSPKVLRLNFNDLASYKLTELSKNEKLVNNLKLNSEDECADIISSILE